MRAHARRKGWKTKVTCRMLAAHLLVCGLMLFHTGSATAATEVALAQQAKISMKILSFEESLKKRSGDKIVIAVIYKENSTDSSAAAKAMVTAYTALGKKHMLHKKKISAIALPFNDELSSAVSRVGASVLYVATGLDTEIYSIAAIAAKKRLPTMCGQRSQLERGIAFAVVPKGKRLGLVINLSAAVRVGLQLDSKLIRLAEVVK